MICGQSAFCEAIWAEIKLGFGARIRLSAVIVDASAVVTALMAIDSRYRCAGTIFAASYTVCGWCFAIRFAYRRAFRVRFVDISSDFEIHLGLACGANIGLVISVGILLTL